MRWCGLLAFLGVQHFAQSYVHPHRVIRPRPGLSRHHKRCDTRPESLLRGQHTRATAAADLAFDVTRERIKLEALSSYGVVTALIMNAALRLLSTVNLSAEARGTVFEKVG